MLDPAVYPNRDRNLGRGYLLAVINSHGPVAACKLWGNLA
jgi:hypothetical protein